jgi:hypothetical protein
MSNFAKFLVSIDGFESSDFVVTKNELGSYRVKMPFDSAKPEDN